MQARGHLNGLKLPLEHGQQGRHRAVGRLVRVDQPLGARGSRTDGGRHSPARRPAEPWETGPKDAVVAYSKEIARIVAVFEPSLFVWHCHMLEHEGGEMMATYRVGP
ncbi:multicopper oxidase domain-containing protein [Microtetraspora fusca]|uniref:Multicopper oxidase domain-containing protein n=1 Tax=Microtetraspora fusca TaxID=1997 RepID=A0ABW6UX15_MICFU